MTRRDVVIVAGGGTGGHLMPALAIASEIRERHPSLEPVIVGAERGVESHVLPNRDFRYHLLPIEPLYRRTWWRNVRWPVVAARVGTALRRVFALESPVAVIGTGGYASVPAVWMATRRNLPSALQEQNAYPGLATRMLSARVRHVYLGVPEARSLLRFGAGTAVFDTGNPIVPPTPERAEAARRRFQLTGAERVLLITGGSQGALGINRAVATWLEESDARGWTVLWITGRSTHPQFAHLARPPRVQVFDFMDPMADVYAVADFVVARAGMITVAELSAWGLPSLLVPLPTAAADHQSANARVLAQSGAAVAVAQAEIDRGGLGSALDPLLSDEARRATIAAAARQRGKPHAAAEIVAHLTGLIGASAPFANPSSFLH